MSGPVDDSSPTSAQKPRDIEADIDEDHYYDASQSLVVPTKLEDGDSPTRKSSKQGHDLDQPRSRPSSSGREVYLPVDSQEEDERVLKENAVEFTCEPLDLGLPTHFVKPPVVESTTSSFTFTAADPRNAVLRAKDPPTQSLSGPPHVTGHAHEDQFPPPPAVVDQPISLPAENLMGTPAAADVDNSQTNQSGSDANQYTTLKREEMKTTKKPGPNVPIPSSKDSLPPTSVARVPSPPLTNQEPTKIGLPIQKLEKSFPRFDLKSKKRRRRPVVHVLDDIEEPISISAVVQAQPLDVANISTPPSYAERRTHESHLVPVGALSPQAEPGSRSCYRNALEHWAAVVEPGPEMKAVHPNDDMAKTLPEGDCHDSDPFNEGFSMHTVSPRTHNQQPPESNTAETSCEEPVSLGLNIPRPTMGKSACSSRSRLGPIRPTNRPMPSSPTHKDSQDASTAPLHSLSVLGGSNKVTKANPARSPGTLTTRALSMVSPRHLAETAQEYSTPDYVRIMRDSVSYMEAKEAELRQALETNTVLAEKLEETRAHYSLSEDKLKEFKSRAVVLKKFINGIGNDLSSLQKLRAEVDVVVAQSDTLRDVHNRHKKIEQKLSNIRRESISVARAYSEEKIQLEKRLSEKAGELSAEKDLSAVLRGALAKQGEKETKMEEMFQNLNEKILGKFDMLAELVGDSQKHDELLEVVKKCSQQSEVLSRQGQDSVKRFDDLKELVETLSSATQKHFEDTKTTISKQPDQAKSLEGRVVGLLEAMKVDIQSQEDSSAKIASLRETIGTLSERLRVTEARILDLDCRALDHQVHESSLKERVKQLEATNSTLQNERCSSEDIRTRLQELITEKKSMQDRLERSDIERSAYDSKLRTLRANMADLQRDNEDYQRRLDESEALLKEARQFTLAEFETERTRLKDEALSNLEKLRQDTADAAIANQMRHTGQLRQAEAQRQLIEKKLNTVISELEPIRSENQLLKEQSSDAATGEKLANDTAHALASNVEALNAQIQQITVENATESENNKALRQAIGKMQSAQEKAKLAAEVQQEEFRHAQKQLSEYLTARKALEDNVSQAEAAAHRLTETHSDEVAKLRRALADRDSRLKLAEEEDARKQHALDEHAQARSNVCEAAVQTGLGLQAVPPRQCEQSCAQQAGQDQHGRHVEPLSSSQDFGSPPTTQVLDSFDTHRPVRRQLKKVNRYQSLGQSTGGQVEDAFSQSTQDVPETQLGEEDMLDNRRPETRGSTVSGFNESALDDQVLDQDGVRLVCRQISRESGDSQPQENQITRQMHPPAIVEETQSQRLLFANFNQKMEEEAPRPSSSLSSTRSLYDNFREFAVEEAQENLHLSLMNIQEDMSWAQHGLGGTMGTTQNSQISPATRRGNAISQGKKRDPLQGGQSQRNTLGSKSVSKPVPNLINKSALKLSSKSTRQGNKDAASQRSVSPVHFESPKQPRTTPSHKGKRRVSAEHESEDVYDIMTSTPVRHAQKRTASQHANAEVGVAKKARFDNAGPAAALRSSSSLKSKESSQSKLAVMHRQGVSIARHTPGSKQSGMIISSDAVSMRRTKPTSRRSGSKIDKRFLQEESQEI